MAKQSTAASRGGVTMRYLMVAILALCMAAPASAGGAGSFFLGLALGRANNRSFDRGRDFEFQRQRQLDAAFRAGQRNGFNNNFNRGFGNGYCPPQNNFGRNRNGFRRGY